MKSVLILIAVFFIVRAVKKSLEARSRRVRPVAGPDTEAKGPAPPAVESEEMVLDEVCGSYVSVSAAISSVEGGRKIFFCSEECRRLFRPSD